MEDWYAPIKPSSGHYPHNKIRNTISTQAGIEWWYVAFIKVRAVLQEYYTAEFKVNKDAPNF